MPLPKENVDICGTCKRALDQTMYPTTLHIFRSGEPHDGVSAGHVHPTERDVVPGE